MRLGIFGGTFDPPHVGHLLAASDAFEALALDLLVFVPAAEQPLKVGAVTTPPELRLEMVRLLAADDVRFTVDPIEISRRGLSYTVDTLEDFARRYPDAERFLLVGADVMTTFEKWREPARILTLARLAVMTRADASDPAASADVDTMIRAVAGERRGEEVEPVVLSTRRVDVSSTEVRARVRAGQTIRGFVPDAVDEFISSRRLYQ